MTEHVPQPHTSERERLFSNIGHGVEGGIITAGGALLLRDATSDSHHYREGSSNLFAGAGALLGVGLVGEASTTMVRSRSSELIINLIQALGAGLMVASGLQLLTYRETEGPSSARNTTPTTQCMRRESR